MSAPTFWPDFDCRHDWTALSFKPLGEPVVVRRSPEFRDPVTGANTIHLNSASGA
jgi:hypothetical protein